MNDLMKILLVLGWEEINNDEEYQNFLRDDMSFKFDEDGKVCMVSTDYEI